jgi:O-antigen/teichoic acid export membrane protein
LRVFKQWPIYFVGRMFPAAIAFGGIALYTRLLDPKSFGTYALCLSMSFFIGLTGFSWLRVAALRMMAGIEGAERADYGATMAVSFAGTAALVALAVTAALRIYSPALPWSSVLLTAAGTVASAWFELNVTLLQARLNLAGYGALQAARAIVGLAASLLLIAAGLKANALLGGFAAGNCASLGALGLWRTSLGGTFRSDIFRRLFRFGWPSSASSLSYFSNTFQRYALAGAAGSAAVGIFSAAYDFAAQTIGLLIGTATLAGQPLAFRARDLASHDALSDQLRDNAQLVFGVALVSAAGLITLAGPVSHLYFGPKFRSDAEIILALSAAVMFFSGFRASYFEQAFEITLKTRPLAIMTVIRIALTVGLSAWLIPRYGAVGAALAVLAAEVTGFVASIVWASRVVHMPVPVAGFGKIALAALAMVGAILLVPGRTSVAGLILAVLAGVVAFALTFALLHARRMRALLGMWGAPAPEGTRP